MLLPSLALIAGLALGALLAWLMANSHAVAEISRIKSALDTALRDKQSAETSRALVQGKLDAMEEAKQSIKETFDSLAMKALQDNNRNFLALAQLELGKQQTFATGNLEAKEQAIANLLTPIQAKFDEFQQKVASLEKDSIAGRTELKAQIENLRTMNERLSADAESLVTALKGSSKTQGDWGEFVLENLLQSAGLRRDFEYRVQKTLAREDGSSARLDVIIDLPDHRHLVIDSKLTLNSYSEYCNCDDEESRKHALRQHIAAMRSHLKELSARNYQNLYDLRSLDFVLMFVPIEPAFMLAIASDSRLWQEAWNKNILLVSPSSLLCVVRTVAQIWRQERQTRNVEAIAKRGRLLYDKFRGFVTDLLEIGTKLGHAREAYDKAYEKLAKADGNLVWQAERLVKLGIRPTKSLPLGLVEEAVGLDEPEELEAGSEEAAEQMEFAAAEEHATSPGK
jgi:DNA recombination protein RmuC